MIAPLGVLATQGDGMSSMWRIELLHPALSHFPIALTLVATVFWTLVLLGRWMPKLASLKAATVVLIFFAFAGAWAAHISGEWAYEKVGRQIYDPRPLHTHELNADIVTWLLTAAAAVLVIHLVRPVTARLRQVAGIVVLLLLMTSSGLIGYTAHLGASLVYQQGAGVELPQDWEPQRVGE